MRTVFLNDLKPFLAAIAGKMALYVPKKAGPHYVFDKYDPSIEANYEINNIRLCTPAKEFLFPLRELAATFPDLLDRKNIEPFAVFGSALHEPGGKGLHILVLPGIVFPVLMQGLLRIRAVHFQLIQNLHSQLARFTPTHRYISRSVDATGRVIISRPASAG